MQNTQEFLVIHGSLHKDVKKLINEGFDVLFDIDYVQNN